MDFNDLAASANSSIITDTSAARFRVTYEPPQVMVRYQESMDRLGHKGNITFVLDDMSEPVIKEYFIGLITLGVILLAFFFTWSLLLVVFRFSKCCKTRGSPLVGFLSGAPFVHHDPNEDHPTNKNLEDEEAATNDTEYLDKMVYGAGDAMGSRPTILRFVFLLSGLICIVFGCLAATQGITNLETSFITVDARANDVQFLANTALEVLTDGLLALTERATVVRDVLKKQLSDDEFCPNQPVFLQSITSGFTKEIMDSKNQVIQVLDQLDDFQDNDLKNIQKAITMITNATADVTTQTGKIDVSGWESLIVLIPYTIFPSLLMMGAILSLFDVSWKLYDRFLHWLILPIFIIMTIFAYVFAAIMTIMAGVNADFCLPEGPTSSPDDIFLSTLKIFGHLPGSWEYRVADFYISQCRSEDPFANIRNFESILEQSFGEVASLNSLSLNADAMAELSALCNRDFAALTPLLDAMNDIIEILALTVAQALDLAQCGRIIPLYTDTVYEAGCVYAPKAIFWIFISSILLGFFGMLMITLRSAMRPSVVLTPEDYLDHLTKSERFYKEKQQSREIGDSMLDDKFLDELGSDMDDVDNDQKERAMMMERAQKERDAAMMEQTDTKFVDEPVENKNKKTTQDDDDSAFARAQAEEWRKYVKSTKRSTGSNGD